MSNNKMPLVSVIMCEYNTDSIKLKKAINSILNQTYSNIEFIIVDDGSKTNVKSIISSINDSRIRLIQNKCNKGFVYSLNKAIDSSSGDYLLRMDTDDISTNNRLEILMNFLLKNSQYAAVGSRALEFSDDDEKEDPMFSQKKYIVIGKKGEKTKKDIMHNNTVIHATALFKKQALLDIGKYKNYYRCEDFVLWCELCINGYKTYSLDDILYYYRVNIDDYNKRKLKKRIQSIKAIINYYPKLNASVSDYFYLIKIILSGTLPNKLVAKIRMHKYGIKRDM